VIPAPEPELLQLVEAIPPRHRPLVAVLPFSPPVEPSETPITLGNEVADLLRERLGQVPELHAILISSEFLSKAPPHALELVCRELRVGFLVSGRCHGPESAPSLYVELTDTRDWHVRWAQFYRGNARRLLVPGSQEMADLAASVRRVLISLPRR
jgi:TolB-like protein